MDVAKHVLRAYVVDKTSAIVICRKQRRSDLLRLFEGTGLGRHRGARDGSSAGPRDHGAGSPIQAYASDRREKARQVAEQRRC